MQALDIPFDQIEEISLSLLDEAGRLERRKQKVPASAPHIVELERRVNKEVAPLADYRNKNSTADDVYNTIYEVFREAAMTGGISEANFNDFVKNLDGIRAEWEADPTPGRTGDNPIYRHGFGSGMNRVEYLTEKEHLAGYPSLWITTGLHGSSAALSPTALVSKHLRPESYKKDPEPYKEDIDGSIEALANDVPDDIFDTWLMVEQLEGMEEEEVDREQAENDIIEAVGELQKRLLKLAKEKDFENIKKDVVEKLLKFE